IPAHFRPEGGQGLLGGLFAEDGRGSIASDRGEEDEDDERRQEQTSGEGGGPPQCRPNEVHRVTESRFARAGAVTAPARGTDDSRWSRLMYQPPLLQASRRMSISFWERNGFRPSRSDENAQGRTRSNMTTLTTSSARILAASARR